MGPLWVCDRVQIAFKFKAQCHITFYWDKSTIIIASSLRHKTTLFTIWSQTSTKSIALKQQKHWGKKHSIVDGARQSMNHFFYNIKSDTKQPKTNLVVFSVYILLFEPSACILNILWLKPTFKCCHWPVCCLFCFHPVVFFQNERFRQLMTLDLLPHQCRARTTFKMCFPLPALSYVFVLHFWEVIRFLTINFIKNCFSKCFPAL